MKNIIAATFVTVFTANPAVSLTQGEAQACANQSITAFMNGTSPHYLIDWDTMLKRERVSLNVSAAKRLLEEKAAANKGKYRNVRVTVRGEPKQSRSEPEYYIAHGVLTKEELLPQDTWRRQVEQITVWMKSSCQAESIAVIKIDGGSFLLWIQAELNRR